MARKKELPLASTQFHPLVEWRYMPKKGRGVFARTNIKKGTMIECSPVVIFPSSNLAEDPDQLLKLHQHIFWWSDKPKRHALGLGFLALYNHSKKPNVEMSEGPLPDTMMATALMDIPAGSELTFDYGEIWFKPV